MLFNKEDNGSEELYELTGSYYASNNYSRIASDVTLAKEEVARVIGSALMDKIEEAYEDTPTPANDYSKLVPYVQMPVALLATLSMYQKNDISHEQDGRKVKISPDGEKLPWEWQLKRDDEIQLNNYFKAVDRLIRKLDELNPAEWNASAQKTAAASLFIRDADTFDSCFPIERSSRLYILLLPFLKEVQRRIIKPALGDDFALLLSGENLTDKQKESLEYIRPPMALFAMAMAMRRLPLNLIPSGVIRNYTSASETMSASEPATLEEVKTLAGWLEDDARILLDEMKRFRAETAEDISLLPENSVDNKFFRT